MSQNWFEVHWAFLGGISCMEDGQVTRWVDGRLVFLGSSHDDG